MENLKTENLKIRLTMAEKEQLESKAKALCLTTSEYIRFRLFEEDIGSTYSFSKQFKDTPFLMRLIIHACLTIQVFGKTKLSKDQDIEINNECLKHFARLDITKQTKGGN